MTNSDNLEIYRNLATDTVYVLAGRDKCGVHLRDLDSEPGDPEGVVTMGEWEFWVAGSQGRMERLFLENEDF